MPKMTVYLPDDLFEIVKQRELPVSELLQAAIRNQLALEEKRAAADRLARAIVREHGEPSARDLAWADALVGRGGKRARRAG